ncbi:hypothetical protein [Pseudonocardia broussonetiae]|uniref:Uncharacterized protein n=1 Tax=Pseudonocardia broussonetiae TaxID=2736640 RepID=A0A6M6JMN9_9PSEU|nr:hypothetical protein [Pseudonocardia broussonetiae]QJY47689.1 hypothetical protein HOP40_19310 [Pseudonocardia broussonetiae]
MRRLWQDRVFVVSLVVAAVAVLIGLVGTYGADPPPTSGAGEAVDLADVDDLRDVVGGRVSARGAEVESVPADEGFWVSGGGDPVWVQIGTAGESPFVVEPGDRVSFTGSVVAHGPDFVLGPEFPAEDAEDIVAAGAHVEVEADDVRLG